MASGKKTILITGAAGFVGSHLCDKYLSLGHRVVGMDNLQTTFTGQNIQHLLSGPDFSFIRHDIIEPYDFKEKFDYIFNFACPAQCVNLQYDPVHTLKTSVHGVINMLELARRDGARIMQASTSEIYGDRPKNPQREIDHGEVSTLGPRACYDEGKRVSETLMMDYHRQYGVDVRIIRIFNTYGPRMYVRDGRVMSNFILRALDNEPIKIYGDGSYTRSFQYISDLVEGIGRMMDQDGFLGPVNLGNPHEITVKELAETIIKSTGSKSGLTYAPAVTDDPVRRQPSIDLAKKELGWEPVVPLSEGIARTVEYFRTAPRPDKKILVFATTYYPDHGPAESALMELAKGMPDTAFHVITVKSGKDLPDKEAYGNVSVYRLGAGNILGKYLYPLRAARLADRLNQEHHYRFAWSIMASYGALAALLFKRKNKEFNFLLSLDKTEIENRRPLKQALLRPLMRWMLRNADSVYLSDPELEAKARLSDDNLDLSVMSADGQGLVEQVKFKYNQLLNKQEKKLDRPL